MPETPGASASSGLVIPVTSGVGEGRTDLAAFDRALFDAGVANYNLLALSSVIPPGTTVRPEPLDWNGRGFGDRLYVVIAEHRAVRHGTQAWAGLGWVQRAADGSGLFVEHHGAGEAEVEEQIRASLDSMVRYREDDFGKVELVTAGVTCEEHPVCAAVVAVFGAEGWGPPRLDGPRG